MNDKVSIIIPAYNAEKYIKQCIDSVLEQTYHNYEIIIVNDGSTDSTKEILYDYKDKYDCIRIINISNHGQGYARNLALLEATGDYVLFLDADDFIEKVTLQVTVEKIKEENSDFVVFDWKYYFGKTGEFKYINRDNFFENKNLTGKKVLELLKIKHYFSVNKLYKKEFLDKNEIRYGVGYIYEDNPFWVKAVIKAKKVSLIQSPLYNVRINYTSTTKTNLDTDVHYKSFIKAISNMIQITKEEPENDYYYLYNYLLQKFDTYYQKRVSQKYKKQFAYDFVEVMHDAIPIKNLKVKNTLLKFCFKHGVFEKKRKFLFYELYNLFAFKRCIEDSYKNNKHWIKEKRMELGLTRKYSTSEYNKALKYPLEDTILFMGFDYRYTGNSRYLFEEMKKQNKNNIFFVTDDEKVEKECRIKPDSKQMYKKLYKSKIVIFETWIPKGIKKRKNSIWIQLWHGTPIKKMLFDSDEAEIFKVDKKHKITKYNNINNWNYLIIDNPNIYKYFETSYLIPKEKVLETGYPRVKYLIDNQNNQELKNSIKRQAGIEEGKKVVLYLPTWRDCNYGIEIDKMKFDYFMDVSKLEKELGEEYAIISKNHVFLDNEIANKITNVNLETQELLLIADYLITDYSSVMFDAFPIDLPVLILAKDYEEYQKSRGVYSTIWQDLLPFVSYDESDLVKKLKEYNINSQEYQEIKQKYGYKQNVDLLKFIINIEKEK